MSGFRVKGKLCADSALGVGYAMWGVCVRV